MPSAIYQTENEIFTRVSAQGGTSGSDRWFKAETKSGLIYEYGRTIYSRQQPNTNGLPIKWYVSRITDLFGNSINFSYLKDNNCLYPGEIKYGPNTITFFYKQKSEKDNSYLNGTKIEQWLILDKITVKYNSTVVKSYEFKYYFQSSLYDSHSMLNEIVEYGIGNQRYNSTAIVYQTPANVNLVQTTYNTTHNYITYKSKLCTGDYNGDGKADFFCLPDPSKGATWTGYKVFYGDGNDNFLNPYESTTPLLDITQLKDIRSIDLNADGKDDLLLEIGTTSSSFFYMKSNGNGFAGITLIKTNSTNNNFVGINGKNFRVNQLMECDNESTGSDFNGDGISDILINDPLGNYVIKSFGDGTGAISTNLNTLVTDNSGVFSGSIVGSDFNGDGKTDIWSFKNGNLDIYSLQENNQIGPSINTWSFPYLSVIGDFNADGKVDVFIYATIVNGTIVDLTNWQMWLSTGTNFEIYYIPQKKSSLKDDYIRLGDFNGDGATDIMVTSKNNSWQGSYYYISSNKGTNFYVHSLPSYPIASHNYFLADYNGDGHTDFICTDGASEWWNGYQVYKTKGITSFLAKKIGDGLGKVTKLAYIKLSQSPTSIYLKGSGATYPVYDFQGPLSVVDTLWQDNGLGSYNLFTYSYEGAKLHLQGKGMLMFTQVKKTDIAMGIVNEETYTYNPTFFYPQLLKTVIKRVGVADTISKVTNNWTQLVLDPATKRILPFIQNIKEFNKLTGLSTSLEYDFDNYGNPSSITK